MSSKFLVNGKPIDYSTAPGTSAGAIERYIEEGCAPGHFLSAVISNDLRAACERADLQNRSLLFAYVQWFYCYAPAVCWGSVHNMQTWMASRQSEHERRSLREAEVVHD